MPSRHTRFAKKLAEEAGLVLVGPEALTITRENRGRGYAFRNKDGDLIRDLEVIDRLKSLAVPPAYRNVRYAADPRAHLQAIGEDAAGRLQYRYHADWDKVREVLKARRLVTLAKTLPVIRRRVGRALCTKRPDLAFCASAVVELTALTAIRPGSESYAREHGTRGATTLLKANARIVGDRIALTFKGKGGKRVEKEVISPRLARALERLREIPGRRLFQYVDAHGDVHVVRAEDVNAYLKRISGKSISLKDFRTLVASVEALESLMEMEPATSARARRSQARKAIAEVAEDLANTPAICRKSYVHVAIVEAFEDGRLARVRKKPQRSGTAASFELLARIVAGHTLQRET
ncbi:DNA topoisomerase IB [Rhodoligotrophos defluvii]|uniref:DNA topoisomerase IB n=1 Tax=Rhodoligotrophos defluvii TaxID=2561934 RepID=UPI0010CA0303|nr:DNA topoisomerase IB [Rhodoligotrophos defluvii]